MRRAALLHQDRRQPGVARAGLEQRRDHAPARPAGRGRRRWSRSAAAGAGHRAGGRSRLAGDESRSTLACPSGSRPPAPTPIAVDGHRRLRAPRVARVVSSAAPVGVQSSIADRRPGVRRDAAQQLGDRGRRHRQVAVRAADVARADGDGGDSTTLARAPRWTKPAQTPTMSAIASSAPTSWKWTSSGSLPWTARLGHRRGARRPAAPGARPARRGARRHEQRLDVAPRAVLHRVRDLTRQRVAAKPLRCTCSTRSLTGSGATGVDRALEHVDGYPGADQGAEQHVAARSRGGVDPDVVIAPHPLRATRAANTPAPYPLSMLTTVTPGRARVEHRQQGGQPAERGAVPDAGRHRDQRHADQPADDRGQRALHPGDHDQAVGRLEPVADAEQPVEAGHADVVDRVRPRRRARAR